MSVAGGDPDVRVSVVVDCLRGPRELPGVCAETRPRGRVLNTEGQRLTVRISRNRGEGIARTGDYGRRRSARNRRRVVLRSLNRDYKGRQRLRRVAARDADQDIG